MIGRKKIQKASLQELADHLNKSVSTVRDYRKDKRMLMLIGLSASKIKDSKLSTDKEVYTYLEVTQSAFSQYDEKQKLLMRYGLKVYVNKQ